VNKAVFLDRDGVINRPVVQDRRPYPARSVSEFEVLPGVADACGALKTAGYLLVVVTNQPDVGRGTLAREAVEEIHQLMTCRLPIDLVSVCFHGGEEFGQPCDCRKPHPGMLLSAASRLQIDLQQSYMVGDRWRDIDCGKRAGCKTIFIDWGYAENLQEAPDYVVSDLAAATALVLG
jgi:D-glycero-D-manno-heptose 1,7-bisphosphate phosphatase